MSNIRLLFLAVLFVFSSAGVRAQTTFNYTGSIQTYTVPLCVTSITIDARGAQGGRAQVSSCGHGARVQCNMAVTPGQVLNIYVGGQGDSGVHPSPTIGGAGGYNGGGNGAALPGSYAGGGGGGASDIRVAPYGLANRMVVAGGGGGAGFDVYTLPGDRGGDGGGLTGEAGYHHDTLGSPRAGGGGKPSAGGSFGVYGLVVGTAGVSGTGGTGGGSAASGGGGGGWYGGGGGAWGGGGGGSSYTDPVMVTGAIHTRGYDSSNGMVIITGCNPVGAITASTFAVCSGATIPVNNPSSVSCGAWTSGNTAIATVGASTGIVYGVSAGTAVITFDVPSACGTLATQTITVNPAPAAITGSTTVCVGGTTALADATGFGGWFSSNTAVATVGLASGVVTGVSMGTAVINYTLLTACMASATVNVDCVSGVPQTTQNSLPEVILYPNPVHAELLIKTDAGSFETATITNSIGQVVKQVNLTAISTSVDVKAFAPGIYYLSVKGTGGVITKRFVKVE